MKSIYLILLVCLCFACKEQTSDTKLEEVKKIAASYAKKQSISYQTDYYIKHFDSDDTIKMDVDCQLIKVPSDSLFGGVIYLAFENIHGSYEYFYDLEFTRIAHHPSKSLDNYLSKVFNGGLIKGRTQSGVKNIYFLNPDKLVELLDDKEYTTIIKDTIINNQNMISVKFFTDGSPPLDYYNLELIFDTKRHYLYSKTTEAKLEDEIEYKQLIFSNVVFNEVDVAALKSKFDSYAKTYTTKDILVNDWKKKKYAKVESVPYQLKGIELSIEQNIHLNFNDGNIHVIDFWYKGCQPCIMSMPQLSKIHSKYASDKIKFWGINPIDKLKDKPKLDKLLQRKGIEYPNILVDWETSKDFGVQTFPNLMVVGEGGQVLFHKIGYAENLFEIMDSVLTHYQ